jgi:small-conductance mechanosensitive channel
MEPTISQLIVQMVSPAVMVSACGLMLLGLGNKYARVVDRIRSFAAEVRALRKLGATATEADRHRLRILELQIPDLFRRGKLLRNALLYCYMAIASFVICSFLIPLTKSWPPLALFAAGMGCVLVAVVLAWREALLSFRLLNLEVAFRPEAQTLE